MRIRLCIQKEFPELKHERWSLLVEKALDLDLNFAWIWRLKINHKQSINRENKFLTGLSLSSKSPTIIDETISSSKPLSSVNRVAIQGLRTSNLTFRMST